MMILINRIFLEEIDSLSLKYPNVNVLRARVQRINENGDITTKEDIFEEYQTQLDALYSIFCGKLYWVRW